MKTVSPYKLLEENILEIGNRPIFFVGAGISIRYLNSPNWKELLETLIKRIKINREFEYYLQKYECNFEKIATELSDYYFELAWADKTKYSKQFYSSNFSKDIFLKFEISNIINQLEEKKLAESLTGEYELLKRTNPHSIITTNYDKLIENTFTNTSVVIGQNIIYDRIKGNKRKVLKIHGCVTKPESIIINEKDYENFIHNKKYLSAKLLTYFIEYPIVIMGYSLSDRNILGILQTISEIDLNQEKINNIWFINYSRNNFDEFDKIAEKNIVLPNNKTIKVNLLNVRNYTKLFNSIIRTNKYPYSITSIANELGFKHWKQIEKYIKELDIDLESRSYVYQSSFGKRYSEDFYNLLKEKIHP